MSDAAYEIALIQLDGEVEFVLAGEFDLATAPDLRRAILERLTGAVPVVVDMGGVTFLDSSALKVFIDARAFAAEQGTTLRLINLPDSASRLLEITGLTTLTG